MQKDTELVTDADDDDRIITVNVVLTQLRHAGKDAIKELTIDELEARLVTEPMSRICPGLFISGCEAAQDKRLLFEHNIGGVLSVNDQESTYDYAKADIRHLYLYTRDHSDWPIEQHFETAYAFVMETMKKSGRNCLIHCAAGMSRSATVALYVLVRYLYEHDRKAWLALLSQSGVDVVAVLLNYARLKRPVIRPEPGFLAKLRLEVAKFSGAPTQLVILDGKCGPAHCLATQPQEERKEVSSLYEGEYVAHVLFPRDFDCLPPRPVADATHALAHALITFSMDLIGLISQYLGQDTLGAQICTAIESTYPVSMFHDKWQEHRISHCESGKSKCLAGEQPIIVLTVLGCSNGLWKIAY